MPKHRSHSAVDQQLLAIHQRIAEKLLQHPNLIEQVEETLERRFKAGVIYRSVYLNWWAVIELKQDMPALVNLLCEQSDGMNRLRRHSPFTGVLTEREREAFFAQQMGAE